MLYRQRFELKSVDDVFESMSHGETLVKFIAVDRTELDENDFSVEIHGFVTSNGELIITHEKVTPVEKK